MYCSYDVKLLIARTSRRRAKNRDLRVTRGQLVKYPLLSVSCISSCSAVISKIIAKLLVFQSDS